MNRDAEPEIRCEDQPDGVYGCECATLFGIRQGDPHLDEDNKDALLDFFVARTHDQAETMLKAVAVAAGITFTEPQLRAVSSMVHEEADRHFDGKTWSDWAVLDPEWIANQVRLVGSITG